MPYIDKKGRDFWDPKIKDLIYEIKSVNPVEGDMNYMITNIILAWVRINPHYARYNSAVGILECVKQELYRREISEYENKKISDNGDVYK